MAALTGYNASFAVSSSTWTPVVIKSASGNITAASGGSAVTIPWVANSHSGSGDTTTKDLKLAVMASMAAMVNDLAANGEPD